MRYFFLILAMVISFSAFAEDSDQQRTQERIDRLEKDLSTMQQQMSSRGSRSSGSSRSSGEARTPAGLEARMGQLEDDMRQLRGKFEETENNINKVSAKMDKIIADIDFRLTALEAAKTKAAAEQTPTAPAVNPAEELKNEEKKEAPAKAEKVEKADTSDKTDTTEKEPAAAAPVSEAQSQYDKALELMKKSDYDKAEKALKDFISANKGHDLVSNAYYWLGEAYYARQNYEQAAVNFLKGYQGKVKGNKAADNLLKLGMSLDKLQKKKEACTTYDKILREFPKDTVTKDKVNAEKTRIKCGA
jgi:tol-pal system protein YbgF